jgi:SpoIID/LytB domain protein
MPRCRILLPALAASLSGAAVALAAVPPAEATASRAAVRSNVWNVASHGSLIKVDGHGWGHGRGMSQYGSLGAARAGLTSKQIMQFYYPGTKAGQAGGQVKVWITADKDSVLTVVNRSGLAVRDLDTRVKTMLPDKNASKWRLKASGTRTVVSFYRGGWVNWRTLDADAEFSAGGKPITLVLPGGRVAYRGVLASRTSQSGQPPRVTVNRLPLEDYLKGVVPRETISSWPSAALQAQAIAARTYAAFERATPISDVVQICDTTNCQVYGGYSSEAASTNRAIRATAGSVRLDSAGKPAFTQFSSSNGGWTVAGSQPYLVAKKDPYEAKSGNPNADWTLNLSAGNVERNYPAVGNLISVTVDTRDGHGDLGGRALKMTIKGTDDTVITNGEEFRFRVGLKSSWFKFRVS